MINPSDRRFTDREAALILRSAAELQDQQGASGVAGSGLSLAQLEQVAMEAGIEPAMVREAVVRLDEAAAPTEGGGFLGAPSEVVVERTLEGELGVAHFDALLDAVRRATGKLGEASVVGRLFGWKGHIDGMRAEVSVSPADARTTVRVRIELEDLAVGHFMLKGALGGVAGGLAAAGAATAMIGGPVGVAVLMAMIGGGYAWSRHGYRAGAAAYRSQATRVADVVVETIRSELRGEQQRLAAPTGDPGARAR